MRRGLGLSLMLALVVSAGASDARQAGASEPVPASAFKGKTLVVPDLGFSIDSPGPKWTWTKMANPAARLVQFYADDSDANDRFIVAVQQPDAPRPLDKADADGFIAGVAQAREQKGWKVGPKGCVPWAGVEAGWRCAFSAESQAKERIQYVAYAVSTTRFYAVQYVGSGEPASFKSFAASFRLLK